MGSISDDLSGITEVFFFLDTIGNLGVYHGGERSSVASAFLSPLYSDNCE